MRLRTNRLLPVIMALMVALSVPSFAQEHGDSFDGPNGTRPPNWVSYGAIDTSFWIIRDGRFYTGNGDDYDPGLAWAVLEKPGSDSWSNYTVGVDLRMVQDSGVVTLAARWIDNENCYYVSLEALTPAGGGSITTQIQIFKISNGRSTSLTSTRASLPRFYGNTPAGPPTRLDFQVEGSNLRAFVNGQQVLTASDPEFAEGTIALGQEYNEVYFDNLRVSTAFDPGSSVIVGSTGASSSAGQTAYRILVVEGSPRNVADSLAEQLSDYPVVNVVSEGSGYSVYVGQFTSASQASTVASQLQNEGFLLADPSPRQFTAPSEPSVATSTPLPVATSTPAPIDLGIPAPSPTVSQQAILQEELSQLALTAQRAEERGDLTGALDIWSDVKVKADRSTARWQEADEKIRSLNQRLASAPPPDGFVTPLAQDDGLPLGLIGGVIAGILVVGGAVFFVITRGKKKDQERLRKLQSSTPATSGSSTNVGSLGIPAPAARPAQQVAAPSQPPAQPQAAPQQEVGPEARIRPGTVSRAGEVAEAQQPPAPAPPAAPPPQAQPPAPAASGQTEESGVKLDFLFEEEQQPPATTPVKEDTTEFKEPPTPDPQVPRAEPTPPVAAPPSAEEFYTQDFEQESPGSAPANWKGDYEYASLLVHDVGASGSSRSLRFEKKQGIGSAYYACRFPNASGRIGVEFDMRCDDKNKYLLGFYIEKDEDFRQSIHTIVHRTNSNAKPTLRLQNEATAYEFGKWAHIRFEIDLPRHIVDGYVDDKPVAMGTRLNNCPKHLNTLSIRDNLATTGSLLIDNIRIYRA